MKFKVKFGYKYLRPMAYFALIALGAYFARFFFLIFSEGYVYAIEPNRSWAFTEMLLAGGAIILGIILLLKDFPKK